MEPIRATGLKPHRPPGLPLTDHEFGPGIALRADMLETPCLATGLVHESDFDGHRCHGGEAEVRRLRSLRIIALAGRNLTRRDDLDYGGVEPTLGGQAGRAPGLCESAHGKAGAGGWLGPVVLAAAMTYGRGVSASH